MLFMNIFTYEPDKRDQIIERRIEKGNMAPESVKIIGQWTALSGGRGFILFEADEPTLEWTLAWSDLMKMEIIPRLDTEKVVMTAISGTVK